MKKSMFVLLPVIMLLISVFSSTVFAQLYISEIIYNPLITESGGEAVELYNSGDNILDISGYIVKTASNEVDIRLPNGSRILANGYFLIADAGWKDKKDSSYYPDADYEDTITMLNTNSGISLIDSNLLVVDKVGWGDAASVDPTLYSVKPANGSTNGESLKRISFTGDNSLDFISSTPDLRNSKNESYPKGSGFISLNIIFEDILNQISNVSVNYDFGNSIMLNPGATRSLTISFSTSNQTDLDTAEVSVDGQWKQFDKNKTEITQNIINYSVAFNLPFYTSAGNHSVSVRYGKSGQLFYNNLTFEVLPLLAFDLDMQSINCSMNMSRSCTAIGDDDVLTHDKPTVINKGNKRLDFKMFASNITGSNGNFDSRNIKAGFTKLSAPNETLTDKPVLYDVNLENGAYSAIPLSLSVALPENAKSGKYSSKIVLLGVADG